jgi:hypothetical protein
MMPLGNSAGMDPSKYKEECKDLLNQRTSLQTCERHYCLIFLTTEVLRMSRQRKWCVGNDTTGNLLELWTVPFIDWKEKA